MTQTLTVVERPWDELKPHPRNPRFGDVDAIVDSLRQNGLYRPIVTTSDGTILAGNHTYMAAGELGYKTLSAVVLPIEPNSDEALRIMLADNRTADLGRYDDGVLNELLQTLNLSDDGLDGTGYTDDDFAKLVIDEPFVPEQDDLGNPTVVVTCDDEGTQEELMQELINRGYSVKGMWV